MRRLILETVGDISNEAQIYVLVAVMKCLLYSYNLMYSFANVKVSSVLSPR